jgi:hypothetical protein
VSVQTLVCKHSRIDPLAIVAHAQSELFVVITNLDLHVRAMSVPEGVAKGFDSNLVDIVA